MLNIGALFATLSMDTGGYTRGILSAQALNEAFGKSFSSFVANPIAGGIALATRAGKAFLRAADEVSAWGESIANLSQQTGVTAQTIQAIEAAAKAAGLSAETSAQGLQLFANRLGEVKINGAAAQELFSRIGADLSGVGNSEQGLRTALDAIAKLPSAAERAAAASDLFGRAAGPAIVQAIGGGSAAIDALIDRYSQIGQVLSDDTIQALSKGGDAIDAFKLSTEGLKRSLVGGFFEGFNGEAGDVEANIEQLAAILNRDLLPAAKEIGEAFGGIVDYVSDLKSGLESVVAVYETITGPGRWIQRQVNGAIGSAAGAVTEAVTDSQARGASERWRQQIGAGAAENRRAGM